MLFKSKEKGFTLIELLIVIAVLGVMAVIVMVAIDPAGQLAKARDAQRRGDIKQISNALEAFSAINGGLYLPASGGEKYCDTSRGVYGVACSSATFTVDTWGSNSDLLPLVSGQYIKKLPVDPKNKDINGVSYYYKYEPVTAAVAWECGTSWIAGSACHYWIGGTLEKPTDTSHDIYRCSDNPSIGAGCKEVADWDQ